MAGPSAQQPVQPPMPYGVANPPAAPAFDPRMGKRPGGTATKVWGILLLMFGGFGAMGLISSVASLFGGFNTGSFAFGMSPEAQAEMERLTRQLIDDSMGRPTYWIHLAAETTIIVLSLAAGVFLVIKPKPLGAKLALARVALVLLALPVYGYETNAVMDAAFTSQQEMIRLQIESDRKSGKLKGPNPDEFMGTMNKIMKGVGYGTVVITVVLVLIINGLLGFQMSRPHVKEFLAAAENEKQVIPGYDPTMGLMMPPPPGPGAPQPPAPPSQPMPPP